MGAVVLAAGASRRLGEAKQMVTLGGETLVERAVRVAGEAGCWPVVVVLGAWAGEIRERCGLEGAVVVVNEGWEEGMGSSIRVGVGVMAGEGVDGAIVLSCDMPAVTAEHLRGLCVAERVVASRYGGRKGVPAYFPVSEFGGLLGLGGDVGAREMLQGASFVDLAGGEQDVDTAEDVAKMRARWG